MTSLVDEIKGSFEQSHEDHTVEQPVVVQDAEEELGISFNAMRTHYQERIVVFVRRGYRQFAGSTLPRESDEMLRRSEEVMGPLMIALVLASFTDGVLIGQQHEQMVKMAIHFHTTDSLFNETDFRDLSKNMACGFADDGEVLDYFKDYVCSAASNLAHLSGYAHSQDVDPNKVWDLWLLVGTAAISTGYLAGLKLGTSWRERDVLDGIEIATEEVGRESD